MARRRTYTVNLSVPMTPEMKQELEELAEHRGQAVTVMIREMLRRSIGRTKANLKSEETD